VRQWWLLRASRRRLCAKLCAEHRRRRRRRRRKRSIRLRTTSRKMERTTGRQGRAVRLQLQTLYVVLLTQQAVMRVLGMEPSAAWKQKLGMRR
jgi:hypothetical protein